MKPELKKYPCAEMEMNFFDPSRAKEIMEIAEREFFSAQKRLVSLEEKFAAYEKGEAAWDRKERDEYNSVHSTFEKSVNALTSAMARKSVSDYLAKKPR